MPNFCPKMPDFRAMYRAERRRMHRHRARRAGAACALAAVALLALSLPWPPEALPEAPDAGAAIRVELDHGVLTDASGASEAYAGIPVPATPRPDQQTKCNTKAAEVRINGGCYVQTAQVPPCPDLQYEHGGRCWVAVGKRTEPANSISQ